MRNHSMLRTARVVAMLLCLAAPAAAARYILEIAAGADVSQVTLRNGLVVVRPLSQNGRTVYLVNGPDPATPNFAKQVLMDPSVRQLEPDEQVQSPETPPTAPVIANVFALIAAVLDRTTSSYFGAIVRNSYAHQPTAALIGLPAVLQGYATGGGIVAVIDTGVDPTHPALRNVLVPGYDFTRNLPGFASELADLNQSTVAILDQSTVALLDRKLFPLLLNQSTVAILDQSTVAILDGSLPKDFGHGTMVSGLIHLVAPNARIMPLKAFNADGSADLSDIVRAIYYAVDNGAKVINMSFSSRAPYTSLTAALQYAWDHNVICIASGGNDGREGIVVHPAADQGTLGIGSTTALDQRSSFSNYDSPSVRMAAPGEALITTYPGNNYAGVWGTSFSTALTSGAAALLVQMSPQISPKDAVDALKHGSELHTAAEMGEARLDVYSTVLYHLHKR